MKLLSLEIEKKIIATSQIIQHQTSLNYLPLKIKKLNKNKNKTLKKEKIILLQLLRLLHYFFHKSNA